MNKQDLLAAAAKIISEASRANPESFSEAQEGEVSPPANCNIIKQKRANPVLSGLIWSEILKRPEY